MCELLHTSLVVCQKNATSRDRGTVSAGDQGTARRAAVSLITSPAGTVVTSTASSAVSAMTHPIAGNVVLGKVYDVSPLRKALYGEHDDG